MRNIFAGPVLFCTALLAQGPVTDRLTVEFKDPGVVGDATLPAGQYTVRQLDTASSPRVFEFVAADGTRTEATASAAPILDNFARHPSSVVLTRRGNNFQLSRIWIEGQSYGYEFAPPVGREVELVAQGENRTLRMTANYTPPGPSQEQLEAERRQREEQERLEAQKRAEEERLAAQKRAEEERLAAQQREDEERRRQEQERLAQQQREQEERERTLAQNTPPPAPPEETKPAPMPATASGWPVMMLGGLLGIGAGVLVRCLRG